MIAKELKNAGFIMRPFCQLKTGSKGSEEIPLLLSGFYFLLQHDWRHCRFNNQPIVFTKKYQPQLMHRLKDDRGCMWMFCSIDGLYQLEKCEKWNDAVSYLYHAWQEQKDRSNLLVRLIGECWYILSLWNCCMPAETMSYDSIKEILYEGIRYGQTHFSEDNHYLCFVGYMLAAPPAWYLFDASTLPSGIAPADEGMRMLRLSVQLEPDSPVSRLLLLGYSDDSEAYNALQQKYRAYIEQLCCDETALTQYFKYILLAPAISTA